MASWATPETETQAMLGRTLDIAEDLIRRGRKQDGLDLVRRVTDVLERIATKGATHANNRHR